MSPDELLAEYERLKALAERLQAENAALQQQIKAQKEEYEQRLAEAQAQIEELRKQLFGPKADRLTAEQEEQLKQLNQDLRMRPNARRRSVIRSSKTKIGPVVVAVCGSSASAVLYPNTWKPRRSRSNRK